MIKNKKFTPSFSEFEESLTSNYETPEYLVQPAKDDKGFEMFQKAFKSQKKYFKPFIRSTNTDLEEN